ncbi:hypothetical protein KC319_g799 [Hortaea werneckii]|nr:hypothetical protein KC317_g247 [Hortaea werneckii]KAI7682819.1 hypothetical protein KC319_g799 [Hortaea werneckii]KAI7723942.1 hypothetical protein KC322_g469 [Hortaea werneckii]
MSDEIDMNKLAISEGNAMPKCEATNEEDSQPFRFFDLPREIRDRIYELVLIPEFPIDFAPLVRGQSYESFWKTCTPDEETHEWHFDHYRKIKAALMLLRTNKQINSEATPIFYGQPFRFSNQSGWLALYQWMKSIGRDKWDMVKDITICHPSFMSFPNDVYPVAYHDNDDSCGPEIDPVEIVSDLPSLRHLRLILTCTQRENLWCNVDEITPGTHPILDAETPAGLSIQAISLMPYYSHDPCNIIDNVAEEFGTITDYPPGNRFKKVVGFQNRVRICEAIEIQQAYADMRDNNVELVGMYYDTHCHFPVFPNKECANKDLCDFLRDCTAGSYCREDADGVCCGTKDEREDYSLDFSV